MNRRIVLWLSWLLPCQLFAQSLAECQSAAERNYPLIRQYDLIDRMSAVTVENIGKDWLPQITATAQATYQSDVAAWPSEMKSLLSQMGVDAKGLKKDQYRVGVDVIQPVYDGGVIKSRRQIAQRQADLEQTQTDVTLYEVRKRVNEMYFSLLLIDEQKRLTEDLQQLLLSNEKKLSSMLSHGTAAESDYLSVKAERLGVEQQLESLKSRRQLLLLLLSTFCGINVTNPEKPSANPAGEGGIRPEERLIDSRIRLADAEEKLLDANLRPRFSLFASTFYGYPGYNMFDDMMHRSWSLNGLVGMRLTWNIGALYTRKGDKKRLQLQREQAETSLHVFLFNNHLDQLQQTEETNRYRKMMESDDEIIALRTSVRKAAESKLAHGIIDVNDLVKEINNENNAKVQRSTHEIEMLKQLYDLRFTVNADNIGSGSAAQ